MPKPDDFEHRFRQQLADDQSFSFFFVRRGERGLGEDPRLWVRDKALIEGTNDWQTANDEFWVARNWQQVLLTGVLQGDVLNVDDTMYAHEPSPTASQHAAQLKADSQWLAGHSAQARFYTVLAAWQGKGHYLRHQSVMPARSPLHAELLVRARDKRQGELLVAAVVEDRVPVVDSAELDVFCTPNGRWPYDVSRPSGPPQRERHRRPRWFGGSSS